MSPIAADIANQYQYAENMLWINIAPALCGLSGWEDTPSVTAEHTMKNTIWNMIAAIAKPTL